MRLLHAPLPEFSRELIESQTIAAAGCRRDHYAWIDAEAVPADARRLVEELVELGASEHPAAAFALGFEFDRRRLSPDELLRRLIFAALVRQLGASDIYASPVAYQSRARWDLYSPDKELLVALNHLVEETDALQHITHQHARTVLWAPPPTDRRPAEGWHVLRYTALQPWPAKRNWFDEVVRQNEQQSAERRALLVSARGAEDRLPKIRAILAQTDSILAEAEFLTLAEED